MAGHQRQLRFRQLAVDDVEVGPANRACANPHEQLLVAGLRN